MPYIISASKRGGRVLAVALGLAALFAGPAHAANIANPYDCTPDATLSQSFSAWHDYGEYTPVSNAGLENGAAGWTLTGGAAVVGGNEPWYLGGAGNRNALDLPAGSSAVSAPLCIDETYPYFRLFARNAGATKDALRIDVLYFDDHGHVINTKPYNYTGAGTAWAPTGMVGINVFTPKTTVAAAPVAFRFTPTGGKSHFQIDDVYVDPWARR
jgi:hypothetical protein